MGKNLGFTNFTLPRMNECPPKNGPFQREMNHLPTTIFSLDIRIFVSFRGSNYRGQLSTSLSFCRQNAVTPPRQIAHEQLHGPISLPANKVCNVSDSLKSEHHFFFGGGLENERSESLLLSFNNSNAQLIIDRGKPHQLYLQKPAFCHALKKT